MSDRRELYRYDTDFFTLIIAEICNYAIDNDMAPDDELSTIANNIKKILGISSFNAWIREGEKLKTGRCHKDDKAEMMNREKVVEGLEKCKRCECDDCTENGASNVPWDCPAYDNFIENAITLLKEQEALEKRNEPVSPICGQEIFGTFLVCGNCGEKLENVLETESINTLPIKWRYCRKCGQAVKWE